MTNLTRLAVIGCGMAAKPHGLALQALADQIEVAGVYARSAERRQTFADTYGMTPADDVQALADDPSIDAVLVLTPPNARLSYVEMFATAGKHILSEKPLERTVAAAQQIATVCADNGVKLGVVFQHRFRAASQALAGLLAEGALGGIRMVRVEVPWWRDQAYYDEPGRGTYARDGGGVLISQAIHTMDLMLSLTGPVTSVQAMTATAGLHQMEAENFAAGAMTFANGAVGSVFATTAAYPGEAESIRLDCDKASAVLQSGVVTIHWRDGRTEQVGAEAAGTGGGADPMAFPMDWHRDLIADFCASIHEGRAPLVTGQDALAVQNLIAAMETSSRNGHRIEIGEH